MQVSQVVQARGSDSLTTKNKNKCGVNVPIMALSRAILVFPLGGPCLFTSRAKLVWFASARPI